MAATVVDPTDKVAGDDLTQDQIDQRFADLVATLPTAGEFSDWPTLIGRQEPWHHSAFAGNDVRGAKAELLGQRIGISLMPWQSDTLREWLRTRDDGKWTHPSCCLIVPRQNGKSEILLLRCLYGLFARGEKIVFTAQRWETAKELGERMIDLIDSRPDLLRRLKQKPTKSQGRVIIETKAKIKNGRVVVPAAKIAFATRSNDAGRGFTKVDLIVYDEAYNLTSGERSAMGWTQMAADNTQKIYTSSAVDELEHPNGQALAGIRRRGLAKGRGLSFREHMAPPELPWNSFEAARFAHPSYGVIATDDKITDALDEVTSVKDQRAYEVDGLGRGRWPADPDKKVREFPPDVWNAMKAPDDVSFTGSTVIALDRSYGDDRVWALTAATYTTTDRVHLELGWLGTTKTNAEMVAIVRLVVELWDPMALVIDRRSPAAVLIPLLQAENIDPVVTNTPQMAIACRGLQDDALDETLSHCDQPALNDSVLGASKRVLPQGDFAWDRSVGVVIAPLVSITLARWGLLEFGVATPTGPGALPELPVALPDDQFDDMWTPDDAFDALSATL